MAAYSCKPQINNQLETGRIKKYSAPPKSSQNRGRAASTYSSGKKASASKNSEGSERKLKISGTANSRKSSSSGPTKRQLSPNKNGLDQPRRSLSSKSEKNSSSDNERKKQLGLNTAQITPSNRKSRNDGH